MVNRESLPLIGALLVPIALVSILILYNFGYDITLVLRQIPILYYIVIFPVALGFIVAIVKLVKND